jgi:F1-F0 ATPase (N-ATPase) AtpR subunit
MTGPALASSIAVAAIFAVAGLGFGLAYFTVLQRSVHSYIAGSGQLLAAALTLGRFAVAALFFGFAARVGALQALAAFIGFLAARTLALYAVRSVG